MAVKLYEGMFLVESAKFAADSTGVTNEILGILEKVNAEVVAHRPWHDGRLAYEIEGHRKGVHYIVMFKMDSLKAPELDRATRLNNTVLRSLIIKQPQVLFDATVNALSGAVSEDVEESDEPNTEEVPDTSEVVAES